MQKKFTVRPGRGIRNRTGGASRNAAGGPANPVPSPPGPGEKDGANPFFGTPSAPAGTDSRDAEEPERILIVTTRLVPDRPAMEISGDGGSQRKRSLFYPG